MIYLVITTLRKQTNNNVDVQVFGSLWMNYRSMEAAKQNAMATPDFQARLLEGWAIVEFSIREIPIRDVAQDEDLYKFIAEELRIAKLHEKATAKEGEE